MAQLYDTIFKRKSIRRYQIDKPVPNPEIEAIKRVLDNVRPLFPNVRCEFQFLEAKDVGAMAVKAPHYIACLTDDQPGALENAGYTLQHADLYLSSRGIGCCWCGMASPRVDRSSGLTPAITLAFGFSSEPLYRPNTEFKRKPISDILDGDCSLELAEAVRVAPSAMNSQPWKLISAGKKIIVAREKLNPIKAIIMDKMNAVDVGIAVCHLGLAAEKLGTPCVFMRNEADAAAVGAGHLYVLTAVLSSN